MIRPLSPVLRGLLLILAVSGLIACQEPTDEATIDQVVPTTSSFFKTETEAETEIAATVNPPATDSPTIITIDAAAQPIPIDKRVLGTNLPAWLGADTTEDETFIARTIASGVTLIRIPGGSWSNGYNWLVCETGTGISGDSEACWSWPWGLRPTDFLNFINATGTEAMYTINHNGTAKEAAALVAFFNGSVDDDRDIGVDILGRDWGKVSDWAQLRRDNGNADPLPIRLWEIGNEIYGGNGESGTDCAPWGWEDATWTCDGTEYVNGIGSGANRKEGYLEFRNAMKAVDSTIMVGAVSVSYQSSWSNWGNEVIQEAGDVMDFYIVHQYAFDNLPGSYAEALADPQASWQPVMADIEAAFDQYAGGRRVPVAVTEYNLIAIQDNDYDQWMT